MPTRIRFRRNVAPGVAPALAEPVLQLENQGWVLKVGDGVTAVSALPVVAGPSAYDALVALAADMTAQMQLAFSGAVAAINSEGSSHVSAVQEAGSSALSGIAAARGAGVDAVDTAGQNQLTAVTEAGSLQVSEVHTAGKAQKDDLLAIVVGERADAALVTEARTGAEAARDAALASQVAVEAYLAEHPVGGVTAAELAAAIAAVELLPGPAGPSAVSADAGNLAKLGTDNLILVDPADLPAGGGGSAYETRGVGFPEGVVTAGVGAYYTDTAATNGAIRWVKASGTGNTGWKVLYGDTGWRNINSLIVSNGLPSEVWPVVSGALLIRRINNQVYTRVLNQKLVFDSVFTPSSFGMILAPTGFEPEAGLMWPWVAWDRTTVYALYFGSSGFFPSSGPQSPLPQSSTARPNPSTSASWAAATKWPTTLPGTPA